MGRRSFNSSLDVACDSCSRLGPRHRGRYATILRLAWGVAAGPGRQFLLGTYCPGEHPPLANDRSALVARPSPARAEEWDVTNRAEAEPALLFHPQIGRAIRSISNG